MHIHRARDRGPRTGPDDARQPERDPAFRIDVLKLPDDKSYDDVIAYVDSGEAEANQDSPDWVAQTRLVRAPANELITANRTLFGATFAFSATSATRSRMP